MSRDIVKEFGGPDSDSRTIIKSIASCGHGLLLGHEPGQEADNLSGTRSRSLSIAKESALPSVGLVSPGLGYSNRALLVFDDQCAGPAPAVSDVAAAEHFCSGVGHLRDCGHHV